MNFQSNVQYNLKSIKDVQIDTKNLYKASEISQVNLFLIILIGYSTNSFWHFAPYSTTFFWGIGLFFHFLGVYGSNLLFGKAWEQKQIEKFMREDQKNNKL